MADNLPEVGLSAVIENLKNFTDAANTITKSYDDMAKGGDVVESSSLSLSGGLTSIAGILSGALVAAAAVAVAAIAAVAAGMGALSLVALNVAKDMESASNAIIIGTGASGEALAEMEGIVQNLSETSAGVGHSYEDMGKTVAEINTRLGLTGPQLEEASAAALKFSRVTGTDAVKSTQLATRVMGDWGVENENLGETLDTIFGASQAFGISTDTLSQKVVQFGAPLRQMGFSLEESIALFGKWEKEGVNSELAIGSLRIAAGKFAKDNIPLREGLNDVMSRIKGTTNESEALAIAMETFGSRAGPDMAAAIRENRFELDSAIEALQGTDGALNDAADRTVTFGDKMEIMWNKVRNSLLPFGDAMLGVADDIMPMLEDALVALQPALADFASFLGSELNYAMAELIPWIQDKLVPNLFTLSKWILEEGIPALTTFASWIYTDLIPAIVEWYKWFKDNILPVILEVAKFIKNDLVPAIQDFAEWITKELIPAVKEIWKWIDKNLVPIFEDLFKMFSKDGKKAGGIMTDIWEDISKAIEPFIEDILPELLEIWDDILAWTKRNWPKVQQIIEEVIKAIQKVVEKVLDWIEDFWEDWGETILKVTETTFGFLWRSIKRALDLIMDGVELFLDILTGDWEGAWEKVLDITKTINDQIKDFISTTWENIKSIVGNALKLLVSDVSQKFEDMKSAINTKLTELKTSISNKFNEIIAAIKAKVNEFVQAGKDLIQGIINGISQMYESLKLAFTTAVTNAANALKSYISDTGSSIYKTLLSVGTSIINAIKAGITAAGNFVSALVAKISESINTIVSYLSDVGNSLYTTAKSIGTAIVNSIAKGITLFYGFTTTIKDQLITWINNLISYGSTLWTAAKTVGKEIVDQIIAGFKGMSNTFNLLKDTIKDWILSWFSPIPEAQYAGTEIVGNIIGGFLSQKGLFIAATKGALTSWMKDINASGLGITAGMNALTGSPSMSGSVSAPLTPQSVTNQTFNVGGNSINNGMDAAVFEARVMDVIRRNV